MVNIELTFVDVSSGGCFAFSDRELPRFLSVIFVSINGHTSPVVVAGHLIVLVAVIGAHPDFDPLAAGVPA